MQGKGWTNEWHHRMAKGAGKFLQRGQKNGKNEDNKQHKQGYYVQK